MSRITEANTCSHCGRPSSAVICPSCFLNYDYKRYEKAKRSAAPSNSTFHFREEDAHGVESASACATREEDPFDYSAIQMLYDLNDPIVEEPGIADEDPPRFDEDEDGEASHWSDYPRGDEDDDGHLFSWFRRLPRL